MLGWCRATVAEANQAERTSKETALKIAKGSLANVGVHSSEPPVKVATTALVGVSLRSALPQAKSPWTPRKLRRRSPPQAAPAARVLSKKRRIRAKV